MSTPYSRLTVTSLLHESIRSLLKADGVDPDLLEELSKWLEKENPSISFDLVVRVHKELKALGLSENSLHELVLGSCLDLPFYVPPPKNPDLVARLAKIQAQVEEKEYKRMVRNVDRQTSMATALRFGLEVSSMNRQLWTVINFVLTVAGSFTFGYFAAHFADMEVTACVFVGLLFGVAVFLADLYFLVRSPDFMNTRERDKKTR